MEDIINVTIERKAYERLLKLEEKMKDLDKNFTLEVYAHGVYKYKFHTDSKVIKKLKKRAKGYKKDAEARYERMCQFKSQINALRKTATQQKVVELMQRL